MSTLKTVGGLMTCFSGFVAANGESLSHCSALHLQANQDNAFFLASVKKKKKMLLDYFHPPVNSLNADCNNHNWIHGK